MIETPRGPNTVAIRNIGQIEFPLLANVLALDVDQPSADSLAWWRSTARAEEPSPEATRVTCSCRIRCWALWLCK